MIREFRFRECRVEDAHELALVAADPLVRSRWRKLRDILRANITLGPAFSVFCGDRIVAAWGIRQIRPGLGTIWGVFSDDLPWLQTPVLTAEGFDYLAEAMWTAKNLVTIVAEEFGFKKIRTNSRKGFVKSARFLKHLGFEKIRRETQTHTFWRKVWD